MCKTLLIPGFKGSDEGHWQRHWQADDPHALMVEQDDWDDPDLEAWLSRLADAVSRHPGSTLVAHSLGVPLVVHLAHRHPTLDIARALLVAPADVDLRVMAHECFRSFVSLPLDRLPFPATVCASRNDPYIAFDRAAGFAVDWGARLIDMGHAGHINIESGYGRWPGAQALLPPERKPAMPPRRAAFASAMAY